VHESFLVRALGWFGLDWGLVMFRFERLCEGQSKRRQQTTRLVKQPTPKNQTKNPKQDPPVPFALAARHTNTASLEAAVSASVKVRLFGFVLALVGGGRGEGVCVWLSSTFVQTKKFKPKF
jgi:hypothetical protein